MNFNTRGRGRGGDRKVEPSLQILALKEKVKKILWMIFSKIVINLSFTCRHFTVMENLIGLMVNKSELWYNSSKGHIKMKVNILQFKIT